MESEVVKFFMDWGISIFVLCSILFWFTKQLTPKIDQNTQSINDLRQAIIALTESTARMYETCERAFDDNRNTISILMKHIEKEST